MSRAAMAAETSVGLPERPDFAFIKTKVPIEDVARELGLEVRHHRAPCWRAENHRNGDAHPSLSFHVRKNRARCWVCDQVGAMSTIDLVMGVLGCDFTSAVAWICERFAVPSAKRGSPIGPRSSWRPSYRVGTSGSELEILVRSGLWAQLTPTQQKILPVLLVCPDTQIIEISYSDLMRYAGVGSRKSIARAVWGLHGLHALRVERGEAVGVVRSVNRYRLTLEDPGFLELLNRVHRRQREEIERERAFRREARLLKNRRAREFPTASEVSEGPMTSGRSLWSGGGCRFAPPKPRGLRPQTPRAPVQEKNFPVQPVNHCRIKRFT